MLPLYLLNKKRRRRRSCKPSEPTLHHDFGFEDHQVYTSEDKNTADRRGADWRGRGAPSPFNICLHTVCLLSMYGLFQQRWKALPSGKYTANTHCCCMDTWARVSLLMSLWRASYLVCLSLSVAIIFTFQHQKSQTVWCGVCKLEAFILEGRVWEPMPSRCVMGNIGSHFF